MSYVVMKEADSDTSRVKELDVVLPSYKPIKGYTTPFEFILPPHKQFPGSLNSVRVCKPPPQQQEPIPIKEAEAELENLHLPSSEEEDIVAVISPDLMISPSYTPMISTPDLDLSSHPPFIPPPCPVTYTPTPPGGHLVLPYSSRRDAVYAEPLLCAKIGLHCYNLENGTEFERLHVPQVAEHTGVLTLDACDPARKCLCKFETKVWYPSEYKDCFHVITSRCRPLPPPTPEEEESGFDILSVDELFKGNMPDWLSGDSKLQYYEMKESEVEQAKEWLHLYAELAWYTKKRTNPFMFEYGKPFELLKITVQTKEVVVDSMKNLWLDNAVFYITFRTRCGVVCKGVIRRTRDGRPEHLSLEAKCFM
ncbi:UPF0725 protein [Raphanus sativus]|uniref:UPF0725 protein At2g20620-like n=1 Tax=Raphanus sativus TaxID=3726 RepID=A0A6J0M979_RAPSA|nr:UPF0725 protein At2g20620-like [Raphanus sativus]KAJ4909226.1 UPF0725 protein [Raphanus sativus]